MKPTIEQVRSHVREHYDLTLTELAEVLNTPLHPKTLRDDFAAKAMQGMFANPDDGHSHYEMSYKEYVNEIARCAYLMADAMLEARK